MKAWMLHDSDYTIFDSMRDSVRFAVERTLVPCNDHLCCKSTFVDCWGRIMDWHDFGNLEGPGWAANAVGGAFEIYWYADHVADRPTMRQALLLVDHVLEDGFVDWESGFIMPYRHTRRRCKVCREREKKGEKMPATEFRLNYQHKNNWFCPGSLAKVGFQMLAFADVLGDDPRADKLRRAAANLARWLHDRVKPVANGWYPRRCKRDGEATRIHPWGGKDKLFDCSADGLFIIQLMLGLTERDLADYRDEVRRRIQVFMDAGGIFGSINHDTTDAHENVAYAVAFRILHRAARLFHDDEMRRFAYDKCLAGLDQFKMRENRNGCQTKGLLYMEKSWDTAYMWENAEGALAYIEAFEETENTQFRDEAFTILQAIAKHHHGPYGFLTEGCDWNDHVGRQHHYWRAKYGDIEYTEPLLNNIHIVEPTLHLMRLWPELTI